jgi:hypothetical protein
MSAAQRAPRKKQKLNLPYLCDLDDLCVCKYLRAELVCKTSLLYHV